MIKSEIRKFFLEKQRNLPPSEHCRKSAVVTEQLFKNVDFSNLRLVNCFITLKKNNELDTSQIFKRIWHEFSYVITTTPRVNFETYTLENLCISPDTKLIENKWQILEPVGNEIVEAEKLDVVFVPLLAFDKLGFRVGYGKGFYDKFLTKCRADCQKIGLSLFPPVEKINDVEDFDIRLDLCVTPERIWRF
jgi:5-formyltetrahydrofolate cyclo-ligase